ncbi:hypothetical protein MTP99_019445 [Tenebrio molitor]|nr:hypothetical protein MTP99_019445 [Tenebrio molitor]
MKDSSFAGACHSSQVIGGELQERLIPVPYSKSSTDQAIRVVNAFRQGLDARYGEHSNTSLVETWSGYPPTATQKRLSSSPPANATSSSRRAPVLPPLQTGPNPANRLNDPPIRRSSSRGASAAVDQPAPTAQRRQPIHHDRAIIVCI